MLSAHFSFSQFCTELAPHRRKMPGVVERASTASKVVGAEVAWPASTRTIAAMKSIQKTRFDACPAALFDVLTGL
jgi:hypothetical protein